MKSVRSTIALAVLLLLFVLQNPARSSANPGDTPLTGDALQPPPRPKALASSADVSPSRYQPSAFLAGRVAVQVIFVESNGTLEASTKNWTASQIADITGQIDTALGWWAARLPNARLSFDLTSQVVASGYEPVTHGLNTEGQWIGDAFNHMGVAAANYFDQAYIAADNLRLARHADWATTIFVANSAGTSGGRFADGHFAYAYINGPFMVVTSDAGPYGTARLAPVVTHEFGHIFGALDQYASAGTPCTELSGYLAIPTTNSQANNCGTHFTSIMLEPLEAYSAAQIDASALGQIGYRDSNNNAIPDPLDTVPTLQFQPNQTASGRPVLMGQAVDQPFPSPTGESMTINTITRVEFRDNGGDWTQLLPLDGAYDSASEAFSSVLPLYDGSHTVQLRAFNSIGASSIISQYSVTVSGVGVDPQYRVSAPTLSNASTISLNLSAPAGSAVQLSEDPLFTNAPWVPAAASMPWNFGPDDGVRTLYIRLRDQNGVDSPVFVRTILLDRTPPSGRAMLHNTPSTWLEILASDKTTSIAAMQINSADGTPGTWQVYQSTMPLALQSDTITLRLRDAAGNVSEPITAAAVTSVWLPLMSR